MDTLIDVEQYSLMKVNLFWGSSSLRVKEKETQEVHVIVDKRGNNSFYINMIIGNELLVIKCSCFYVNWGS